MYAANLKSWRVMKLMVETLHNKKHQDRAYLCQGMTYQCRDPDRDRYPDRHQNLIVCSLAHCQPSLKISCKSLANFMQSCIQTNKQTHKQRRLHNSLAEVIIPWERLHGAVVRRRIIGIVNVDSKLPTPIDLWLDSDGLLSLTAISSDGRSLQVQDNVRSSSRGSKPIFALM